MRLFYRECPFPSVSAENPQQAAELLREGHTVCVPDESVAWETLVFLGLSPDEAGDQIRWLA